MNTLLKIEADGKAGQRWELKEMPMLVLMLCILLAAVTACPAQEPVTNAIAACQKDIQARMEKGGEEYLQGLDNIAKELQQKGALEQMLLVREEQKRFKWEGSVETKDLAQACPPLRDWQTKFMEYQTRVTRSISSNWVVKLEQQKVEQTKAGNIEEALATKKSIAMLRQVYRLDEPPLPPVNQPAGTPITNQEKPSQPADEWKNAINLLPLIDPARDAVCGVWKLENGELVSDKAGDTRGSARLQTPYRPPQEYDVRITFTRREGIEAITQMLYAEGRAFDWVMDGWRRHLCMFRFTNESNEPDTNPTRSELFFVNGRRYTSLVQVRKNGVKAYVDGKLISQWATDFHDMSREGAAQLRDNTLLGVGTYQSIYVFHRIEVREVTGKGTITSKAPAATASNRTDVVTNLPKITAVPSSKNISGKTNPFVGEWSYIVNRVEFRKIIIADGRAECWRADKIYLESGRPTWDGWTWREKEGVLTLYNGDGKEDVQWQLSDDNKSVRQVLKGQVVGTLHRATSRWRRTPPAPVTVKQWSDGGFMLTAEQAQLHGWNLHLEPKTGRQEAMIKRWNKSGEFVSWNLDVRQPGIFHIFLKYASPYENGKLVIEVMRETAKEAAIPFDRQNTGGWEWYKEFELGAVEIRNAGTVELSIRSAAGPPVINVQSLRLRKQ